MVNLCLMVNYSVEGTAQTYTTYDVSFDNAVHHEAKITVRFENLDDQVLEIRMSRSSPGRYAVHEFAIGEIKPLVHEMVVEKLSRWPGHIPHSGM